MCYIYYTYSILYIVDHYGWIMGIVNYARSIITVKPQYSSMIARTYPK